MNPLYCIEYIEQDISRPQCFFILIWIKISPMLGGAFGKQELGYLEDVNGG